MSTFDIEEPEEVWPEGIQKNLETVKKSFLLEKKKSLADTRELNKHLNKSMKTTENSLISPQSIEFLDSVIRMQAGSTEKKSKGEGIDSNSSKACMRLEKLINRQLQFIVEDTYEASTEPEIEEIHQELTQLFTSMIDTQAEGSVPIEYSPKLEAVLSRIALIGLVTLDPSNNTVEFEL